MNGRTGMNWSARLLIGLVLIIVGAGAAAWSLAHYPQAARFLGVAPVARSQGVMTPKPVVMNAPPAGPGRPETQSDAADAVRIAALEQRVAHVENATQRAEGFAGRAD